MLLKPNSCVEVGCPLAVGEYGKLHGHVPSSGAGSNGVCIIAEAAGADEEIVGHGLVGRAGQYLFSQLQRVGIERDGFRLANTLECRPPGNALLKMPYTDAAIKCCAPNLDRTIAAHVAHCLQIGKTPVILALGKFAFKRVMGIESDRHPIMLEDYGTYPHWVPKYSSYVIAAPHPSHIMQGHHQLANLLQFCAQRAITIAAEGLTLDQPTYLLDPPADVFKLWVDGYFEQLAVDPLNTYLSYDIETPYKRGKREDEIAREDDDDYTILRCSFCYAPGNAVSVVWDPEHMADIERLFQSTGFGVGHNNSTYDDIRIMNQMPINMTLLDAMLAWHVLNTSMPKALGFITPFYWRNTPMWKHLADGEPAFYNAKDADATLRNFIGIKNDLIKNNLWTVFETQVVKVNEVLSYMSRQGILLDRDARAAAEVKLQALMDGHYVELQAAVPTEARQLKVYKKIPKVLKGLGGDELTHAAQQQGMVTVEGTAMVKRCNKCGMSPVKADHFKSIGPKARKRGDVENLCVGGAAEKVELATLLYALPLEFKISKVSLLRYLKLRGHRPIISRKEKKITFDVNAMKTLIKQHPEDPLYPIIGRFKKVQKLLSTYVGVTKWKTVEVEDDYELQVGEVWV